MTPSQLSLLELTPTQGQARKNDPRTSMEAARTCDAQNQKNQIMRLLSASLEGMTADELAEQMHPHPHRSTVASRLAQLGPGKHGDDLVYPFGVRRAPSGRSAQVWFVKAGPREVDVPTGEYL